jgi:hypothetical protein
MGTSFVSINRKGFWMNDSVLELWLRLLALHIDIEESPEKEFVGRKIRDNWLLASSIHFMGCVPDRLDEAVSTDEGREVVIQAINSLIDALKKGPETLDGDTLSLLGFQDGYGDFEGRRLIEVGNAFLALIAGEVQEGPGPKGFMPGMP